MSKPSRSGATHRPLSTILQLALAAWGEHAAGKEVSVDLTAEEWDIAQHAVEQIGEDEADIDATLDAEWAKRAA
jgi:hypothetical protein